MLAMAFVYVSAEEETDAAVGYHKVGDLYYKIIDDADTRTYTEKEIGDYDGMIYIDCETVKPGAFEGYDTLVEVLFSSKVKTIGEDAFKDCPNLTHVRALNAETIGAGAFSGSGIQRVTLGSDLVTIGEGAFRGCDDLWYLPLWETNVTSIPAGAFADSGIRLIDLRKVASVDPAAFTGSTLDMQMVRSAQGSMVSGVPMLINDDDENFEAVWKAGTEVRFELGLDQYIRVTEVGKTEDLAVHDAPGYRDTVKEAGFTAGSGLDYQMTFRHATVTFHEITGLDDVELSSGDFPYTLPRPALGDLTLISWTIDGLGTGITSVTLADAREMGGLFVATPVYGTATLTMDHSAVSGLTDASDLQTSMDFTYGDRYPELPDLDGYRHTGWMVDGVLYRTGALIESYADHTASSVWEPTKLFTVRYLDVNGEELGRSTHGLNALVMVDGRIVPEEAIDQEFSGWTVDGSTRVISFRVTANVELRPLFDERPLRTITLTDGDSVLWETTGYEGRTVVIDADDPLSDTRVFQGWGLAGDILQNGDVLTVRGDMVLTAQWEDRETFDVRFHDGTGIVHTGTAYDGVPYTVDADDPTAEGKVFLDWIGPDGQKYGNGDSLMITAETEFTAEWRNLYTYTIHFDDGHGSIVERQVTEGETLEIDIRDPVADDGVFEHWTDSEGNTYRFGDILSPTGPMTLSAQWRALKVFDIVFDDGHGNSQTLRATEGKGLVITIDDPTAEGEVFLGWMDQDGIVHQRGGTLHPGSEMRLEAQWRPLYVYDITFDDGRGVIATRSVTEGDSLAIDVPDPVWDGSMFLHWTDPEGNKYSFGEMLTPTDHLLLTAQWRPLDTYWVVFMDDGSEIGRFGVTERDSLVIEIDDPVRDGFDFEHWTDGEGNEYAKGDAVTPIDDVVLTSSWRELEVYRVTFDDGSGNTTGFDVTEGDSLTIDVDDPAAEGKVFLNWTDGEGNGYSRGDVIVPTDHLVLTAEWRDLETFRINFIVDGTTVAWYDVTEGESLTIDLADPVSDDRVFLNWTDSAGNDYVNGDTVTPSTGMDLVAEWRDLYKFRVDFYVGDDLLSWSEVIEGGSVIIEVDDPTHPEMMFDCWTDPYGNRYAYGDEIAPTDDVGLTAQWREPHRYEMRFDDGRGWSDTLYAIEGREFTVTVDDPVSPGEVFEYWTDRFGNVYSAGDTFVPTDHLDLKAVWRDLDTYTVEFFVDDDCVDRCDVTEGDSLTIEVDDPTSEGRAFVNWTDSDGRGYSHGDTVTPAGDMKLYAQWRDLKTFWIVFDDGMSEPQRFGVQEGQEFTINVEDPTDDGRFFEHWTDGCGNVYRYGDSFVPASDVDLTAEWRDPYTFTVLFDDGHGSIVPVEVVEGDGTEALPTPVSEGEVFEYWTDPEGVRYDPGDEVTPAGDGLTLTAQWRDLFEFKVTFDDGHGRTSDVLVTEGETLVISVGDPVSEGEVFTGWTDPDGNVYRAGDEIRPTADVKLTASWRALDVYDVVLDDGHGRTATIQVTEGTGFTIPTGIPLADGEVFVCWEGTDGFTYMPGETIAPAEDFRLDAVWRDALEFDVVFDSGTGNTETVTVMEGGSLTIGEDPVREDMVFQHWKSADGDTFAEGDVLTPTDDMVLTASWRERLTFPIAYVSDGETVGTDTAVEGIPYVIGMQVDAPPGMKLTGWTVGDTVYGDSDTVVIESPTTFTAIWTERDHATIGFHDGRSLVHTYTGYVGDMYTISIEDPVWDGRVFICWTDGYGNEYVDGDSLKLDGDIGLDAVWRDAEVFEVTIGDDVFEVREGDSLTIDAEEPQAEGKEFICWEDGEGNQYGNGDVIVPDGDVILTPVWRDLDEHTITYISRGATVGTTTFYDGEAVKISCHPSRSGYSLSGWSVIDRGPVKYRNGQTLEPDGDLALYAVWRLNIPVYPSHPGDNDDMVQPTDPADPVDPTDPDEPADPTEPTDPGEPDGPDEPTGPEDPGDDERQPDHEVPTTPGSDTTEVSGDDGGGSGIGTHAVLLAAAVAAMMVALMAVVLRRS